VGEYQKSHLRELAAARGLVTARKPDSHDVCFIPSGDLGGFLRPHLGERRGAFVGPDGSVLGFHDGAYRFTVGQRRGLGLAGFDEPLYVTAVDGDQVHVGPRALLETATLDAFAASWVSGEPPGERVHAQVRYRGEPLPARLRESGPGRLRVEFTDELPLGIAPGQAVVFYDADECLGGATIAGGAAGEMGALPASRITERSGTTPA
jgi:tRNA-specific 2-thiouridylase